MAYNVHTNIHTKPSIQTLPLMKADKIIPLGTYISRTFFVVSFTGFGKWHEWQCFFRK